MIGVYKITNSVTGNFYIGSSSSNIKVRKRKHFDDLEKGKHHNKPLQRAYDKYGKENLVFDVLCVTKKEQTIDMEQLYMDWLKPEYNTCKKARSVQGVKRSKEFCEGISKRMMGNTIFLGKKVSDEAKAKISKANKGRMPYTFGKKREAYVVEKIAQKLKGKKRTEDQKAKIKIANKKRYENGFVVWNKGLKMSKYHIEKNREQKEIYLYEIEHITTGDIFTTSNLFMFCKDKGLASTNLAKTFINNSGKIYKQAKGYRILTRKSNK